MNVDLFRGLPSWTYYVYASLILFVIVFLGYGLLRGRRRVIRILQLLALASIYPLIKSLESHQMESKNEKSVSDIEGRASDSGLEVSTILKWAASSGRTDLVRKILETSSRSKNGVVAVPDPGPILLLAMRNGHQEAAALLIELGEGLDYVDENKATLLHCAAKAGQSALIKMLLEKGVSISARDLNGQTALDYAMAGHDETTINLLLRGGKEITRQETANIQSLHFSARIGDLEAIKELHRKGSSLEARDGKGQSVLFHAVKSKQQNIVKWLLDHQANVHSIDKEGLTALHVAAHVCNHQAAEALIDHGANINAFSVSNLTPLLCIPKSEGVSVLRLLHRRGADINAVDKSNNRLAHKAAGQGDRAALLLKVIRDLGGRLNTSGSEGNTPAHRAAESGSVAILEILGLGDDSIYNSVNDLGYTPLMSAARAAQRDAMRYLLSKKSVSYDVSDSKGKPLVQLAVEWGNREVMQVLQDFGASYNDFKSSDNNAHPIWRAIYEGQQASIEHMLDSGLDVNYIYEGVSLLQLAAEVDNADAVRSLLHRGASVDAADKHGWTALHSAAFSGNDEYVYLILQEGGDHKVQDEEGWTPLDIAAFYKHDKVIKILDPEGGTKDFAWMRSAKRPLLGRSSQTPSLADSVVAGSVEAPGSNRRQEDVDPCQVS